AIAQGQSKADTDLAAAKATFVGVWEGPVRHGDGNASARYRLELRHDTAWKVTADIVMEQTMTAKVYDFRADGSRATWKQELMGQTCTTTVAVEEKVLKGETQCGGAHLGFELRKKS